ncbi:hypothetical protein [Sphingopyxis sp.]|uniref:hypothetical protein n=1 Tax=Sphingopyxis sp. TaxID=1908224 RepID=UPI003BAB0020
MAADDGKRPKTAFAIIVIRSIIVIPLHHRHPGLDPGSMTTSVARPPNQVAGDEARMAAPRRKAAAIVDP